MMYSGTHVSAFASRVLVLLGWHRTLGSLWDYCFWLFDCRRVRGFVLLSIPGGLEFASVLASGYPWSDVLCRWPG
jgi:hypothetical protein